MFLGLDIGTSSVEGLLQSEDGEIVESHSIALAISRHVKAIQSKIRKNGLMQLIP